jgi:AbrB family looped-hinge helix DNA binding protein
MEVKRTYTIQENGQVTLPAEWLRKYGLKKGDIVSFSETQDGTLIVVPRIVLAMNALDEIGDALKAKGKSLEDLMERGRDIRADLLKEKYDIDASEDE